MYISPGFVFLERDERSDSFIHSFIRPRTGFRKIQSVRILSHMKRMIEGNEKLSRWHWIFLQIISDVAKKRTIDANPPFTFIIVHHQLRKLELLQRQSDLVMPSPSGMKPCRSLRCMLGLFGFERESVHWAKNSQSNYLVSLT